MPPPPSRVVQANGSDESCALAFAPIALLHGSYVKLMSTGGGRMHDNVDLRFHDQVALDEIDLYAEVLSAVAIADRSLTTDEIDEVLGLRHRAGAEIHAC
jgi:hypothetical protein